MGHLFPAHDSAPAAPCLVSVSVHDISANDMLVQVVKTSSDIADTRAIAELATALPFTPQTVVLHRPRLQGRKRGRGQLEVALWGSARRRAAANARVPTADGICVPRHATGTFERIASLFFVETCSVHLLRSVPLHCGALLVIPLHIQRQRYICRHFLA